MAPGTSECVRVFSVLAQVLLIGSLTLFWLQLWFRGWLNSVNNEGSIGEAAAVVLDSGAAAVSDVDIMERFYRLSLTLFEERQNISETWATQDRSGGYLDSVQVVQVPQAGNRQLGVLAKRLIGCNDSSSSFVNGSVNSKKRVSERQFLGDLRMDCPKEGFLCLKVLDRAVLANEMIISLSQMRSPVERLVSAFVYGAHSHPCALSSQTKEEVQECFMTMTQTQALRNIAGRVYTGHSAYSDVSICHSSGDRRRIHHAGRGRDTVEDGTQECRETLVSAMAGLCLFNHIALTEAPGVSALLLLETLPWIRPKPTFFEGLPVPLVWSSQETEGSQDQDTLYLRPKVSQPGNHEPERLQYITQDLRDMASASNQVDEVLYDVVCAKMCSRLSRMNLLKHPVVEAELATCPLGERCASKEWYEGIIDSAKGMIKMHSEGNERCRLFQPFSQPPPA